jgi:hypothetical protein
VPVLFRTADSALWLCGFAQQHVAAAEVQECRINLRMDDCRVQGARSSALGGSDLLDTMTTELAEAVAPELR